MQIQNPFKTCPVYETDHFTLRKVEEEDAIDLFRCYSDPITLTHINNDNCGGDWNCSSIEVMRAAIRAWNKEFALGFFIRWSVKDKALNRHIGTIEIAPIPNTTRFWDGACRIGILRMDLVSTFEWEGYYAEILRMVTGHFYHDFGIETIITKLPEENTQRLMALEKSSFRKLEDNKIIPYGGYYICERSDANDAG